MWLYSRNNFLSIVEDKDDPGLLLVRARFEGDIEAIFPKAEVKKGMGSDYLFRAWVERATVAKAVRDQVMDIDYTNFKNANNKGRQDHLMRLWNIMYSAQDNSDDSADSDDYEDSESWEDTENVYY